LPILDEPIDSTNAYCSEFVYTITPGITSDVDLLFTIDDSTGILTVEGYSSQSTLDHTYNGVYEYTIEISSPYQTETMTVDFTFELAYQCFDPSTVTLTTNDLPTGITASRSTQ
jgi:hypothetical protein